MTQTILDADLLEEVGLKSPEQPQRAHTGPLLIAGDDAGYARGALRLAELLARRDRVNAHILGVVRPLSVPTSVLAGVGREALEETLRRMHHDRIRQLLHQTTGLAAFFTVETVTGHPAPALARAARERGAEIIIVGIEEQGRRNRTETEDAVLQIARAADVPVLAVPGDCALLPRRAIVAMDFSSASLRAAEAAIPLLSQDATLTLVYVEPDVDFTALGEERWAEIHADGVVQLVEQLRASLSVPGDVEVETAFLRGDAAAMVLDYARAGDFDLVATGTHGQTALERHLTGSVSTALLRGTRCPVLIAPPPEVPRAEP